MNAITKEIIFVVDGEGSVHDFTLYQKSIGSQMIGTIEVRADSDCQGILNFHSHNQISIKKSKHQPLTDANKSFNGQLASERVAIEHINVKIKVFHSMSNRYRNREGEVYFKNC